MSVFTLIAIIFVLVVLSIASYNALVQMRSQVRNAWKQIDIQLKRRHDLIPNLVQAVRGQMRFEKETLERVITARSAAVNGNGISDIIKKEQELTEAVSQLIIVSEKYPTLKSNVAANQLMEELITTENQISFARQFYNDLTTLYNTKIESFPTNLFAKELGFNPILLFQITKKAERETPAANISTTQ